MSAYVYGRGGTHLYPLNPLPSPNAPSSSATESALDQLPPLPQIAQELDTYFAIARQIEATLIQEKANLRKNKEELQDLRNKYARLSTEAESRAREYQAREERYKSQVILLQQAEQTLHEQVKELCRQVEHLRGEKKKVEADNDVLRTNCEHYRKREQSLGATLQSLQSSERARSDASEKSKTESQIAQAELRRYQTAWTRVVEIDRKAKQILNEFLDNQKKLEGMNDTLEAEKKRRDDLEESLRKEKRDKQIALSCLHTAESRLAQLTKELEELRNQKIKQYDGRSLELKF